VILGIDKILSLVYTRRNTKEDTMDGIDDYFDMMFYSQGE
jgi:hypothetical protein